MPKINLGRKKSRDRTYNKSALQKYYNTPRWKRLREYKFQDNPICEICYKNGIVTLTEEVHHIIPIDIYNPNEALIYDYNNLMSLCKECHVKIHSRLRGENPVEVQINERREVR
jgi:5-methylcytosine-specific restriction protein A